MAILPGHKRCEKCNGKGQFMGTGYMMRKCGECDGNGTIKLPMKLTMDEMLSVDKEKKDTKEFQQVDMKNKKEVLNQIYEPVKKEKEIAKENNLEKENKKEIVKENKKMIDENKKIKDKRVKRDYNNYTDIEA